MPDIIIALISAVFGGGLSSIISVKYVRRQAKLDYAERAIKFMEEQEARLKKRMDEMDKEIELLKENSCFRESCDIRIKS